MITRYATLIILILSACLLRGQDDSKLYSDSITVNFFLLDECRITQNMSGEISRLYDEYDSKHGLVFRGFFPNHSTKEENVVPFMNKYGIEMPFQMDYNKKRAILLGATVAPEVVVYDERKKEVIYRGRIDNSYDKIGSRRRVTTDKTLEKVLIQIGDNSEISKNYIPSIGCSINFIESKID